MCFEGCINNFILKGKRLGRLRVRMRLLECLRVDGGGGRRVEYCGMSLFLGLWGRMDKWEVVVVSFCRGVGWGDWVVEKKKKKKFFSIKLEDMERYIIYWC